MAQKELRHARLRLAVDEETGAIRALDHLATGLSLIADPARAAARPFMVILEDGTVLRDWQACTVEQVQPDLIHIHWTLAQKLDLQVRLQLDATTGDIRCTPVLQNPGRLPVAALAYPYLAGIGRLGADPEKDELVHPYATGFLVRNPLDSLPPVVSETVGEQPVVLGLYPEGFSGSTLQCLAYSAAGRGGFYVATEDGEGREKWLNFYRHPDGDLRLAIWHAPTDYATHREVQPPYTTVLAALDGGTWYDMADRYRSWALAQPWAARGPLWAREDRPRWLFEQVGVATFGINARYDRTPWLQEIDHIAGTPVLHLLGPNWPKTEANYHNSLPGGLADWFPTRFSEANLALIRANKDYLVPFEFDLLFGTGEGKAAAEAGAQALQTFPTLKLSRDAYHFPFLCPASPFTRTLHVERDRALVVQHQVDGVYYDISVNNVRHICLSTEHGHIPGETATITTAYKTLLAETAEAMREAAAGRTIPQGAEMINEQMLPYLWFYQARAEATPAAPFEAGPLRELIKQGSAEKIPLFTYVYHEYGPVRLDGWAKLSAEQGDLVYFVLGRVFLQGGLIELNYEFSPLEDLHGRHDVAAEHYWHFDERHYAVDPDLAQFVGRLARTRLGPANRYLAYGAMCRPGTLAVDGAESLDLSYFLYNCGHNQRGEHEHGTLRVPVVLHTAWRYRTQGAAWLLLNLSTEPRSARIDLDLPTGVAAPLRLSLIQEGASRVDLGALAAPRTVALTLPARCPVMVEALPA